MLRQSLKVNNCRVKALPGIHFIKFSGWIYGVKAQRYMVHGSTNNTDVSVPTCRWWKSKGVGVWKTRGLVKFLKSCKGIVSWGGSLISLPLSIPPSPPPLTPISPWFFKYVPPPKESWLINDYPTQNQWFKYQLLRRK